MTNPNQFDPAGPPDLSSQAYADAVNLTGFLGVANSTTRTADETQIANFWKDGVGTFTPAGHWNNIAEQVAQQEGDSLAQNARLFAELNVALADAAIAAWNTKYTDNTWRPITVIQNADSFNNAGIVEDPRAGSHSSSRQTFLNTFQAIRPTVVQRLRQPRRSLARIILLPPIFEPVGRHQKLL